MTRKDYTLLASVFAKHYPDADTGADIMWEDLLLDLARELVVDNPEFDFDKFMQTARNETN